jgi:hypothetical protein
VNEGTQEKRIKVRRRWWLTSALGQFGWAYQGYGPLPLFFISLLYIFIKRIEIQRVFYAVVKNHRVPHTRI